MSHKTHGTERNKDVCGATGSATEQGRAQASAIDGVTASTIRLVNEIPDPGEPRSRYGLVVETSNPERRLILRTGGQIP